MAGIAQEGAGVGEHADEVTQQAQVAQGDHLVLHANLIVIEPPGRTVLDLAGDGFVLEAANQGAQLCIVGGIQGVQDGLGAGAFFIQSAQQRGDVAAAGVLCDGIHAGVAALCLEDAVVVVTQAGVMQLHDDAQSCIGLAQHLQDHGLEAFDFLSGELFALQALLVNSVSLLYGVVLEGNVVQTVVGSLTATGMEVLQTLNQGIQNVLHGGKALLANGSSQLSQIFLPTGLVDVHSLVGAVGGANHHFDGLVGSDLLVPLQRVDGVVSGADEGNICLADQTSCTHLGVVLKQFIALVPDALCALGGQGLINAEELLQFQMAPVIHGVADGHFQSFHELHETLEVGLGAGDVLLRRAVGAHNAPLVVVTCKGAVRLQAAQPHLCQILKTAILIYLLGIQVAVVVHQGKLFRIVVEQMLCGFSFQKEILIHKCFHVITPLQKILILL